MLERRDVSCLVRTLVVLLFLAVSANASSGSGNVILNGSFEAVNSSTGRPLEWSFFAHDGDFTVQVAQGLNGTSSLHIVGRATTDGSPRAGANQNQSTPIVLGSRYELRLKYKGDIPRADILLRLRPVVGGPADELARPWSFDLPGNAPDWADYVFLWQVPPELVGEEARIELLLYGRGVGEAWYDDIELVDLADQASIGRESKVSTLMPANRLATDFRPEPGALLQENAPSFTWPIRQDADLYYLRLAQDAESLAGSAPVHSKLNVYTPSAPLTSGIWYWQVEALREGKVVAASDVMSITVPDTEVLFALPTTKDVLATLRPHPRIYFNEESWDEFRSDPRSPLVIGLAESRSYAHLGRALEPEPTWVWEGGGSPDGVMYTTHVNPLINRPTFALTSRLEELAWYYVLTREDRFGAEAKRIALHLASWDPSGSTSYRNADQAFREIAVKLALAYDWLYPMLDEAERAIIREAVVTRARVLYEDFSRRLHEQPYDSHAQTAIGYLGTITLAVLGDAPEAITWFDYVLPVYTALFPPWGGDAGGWSQGVTYQQWSIDYGACFWLALKNATGVDYFDRPWYRNAGYFKLYFHPPLMKRSHFGDGNDSKPSNLDAQNMAYLASQTGNGYFKWYAEQLKFLTTRLDPRAFLWLPDYQAIDSKNPADLPPSVHFPDIGWVAMHSRLGDPNGVSLFFKSSPYGSYNHSHADQNSFVLYAFGEPLAIDTGAYDAYGSEHDKGWTRQTKAHNAVLIGGEGQPIWDMNATGQITAFYHSPGLDYTAADAAGAYMGKAQKALREIVYRRPDYFVVADTLRASQETTYQWLLHALSRMDVDAESNRVTIDQGRAHLDVQFVVPGQLAFTQTDDFGIEPLTAYPREWHLSASTTESATEQRFLAMLMPYEGSRPTYRATALPVQSGMAVKVDLAGSTDHFFFADENGKVGYDTFCAQGAFAMYGHHQSNLTGWSLVNGTALAVEGYEFTSEKPISASWQARTDGGILTIEATEPVTVRLALPFAVSAEGSRWQISDNTVVGTAMPGRCALELRAKK